jgi:nucleoside-diphosphate-sugar epimerase
VTLPHRVLVTGATGFVGVRLVERLTLVDRIPVRALIHRGPSAVRLAHLPIETAPGDVLDRGSLAKAMEGCDTVVHLATGGYRGLAAGTRNVVEVASRLPIRRLVHMSSTAVYGLDPPATVHDESAPLRRVGEPYCDGKVQAELAVRRGVRRGVPAVILRPSIIYGPGSRWNSGTLERLVRGEQYLVDDGAGVCNLVHVDDLIEAILVALAHPGAVGQTFFIAHDDVVTWREFIEAHAELLVPRPVAPRIAAADAIAHYRAGGGPIRRSVRSTLRLLSSPTFQQEIREIPIVDDLVSRLVGALSPAGKSALRRRLGPPPSPMAPRMPDLATVLIQSCRVKFRSEAAQRVLGYVPRVSFVEGMKATAEWLDWAGFRPRPAAVAE